MIIAVVLIIAAIVVYLLATIVALRKINRGLDDAIAAVGEIVEKSAPVNGIVTDINAQLDAGVDLLEGLLVKKAGLEDAVGLIDGLYPGAAKEGLRNFPDSKTITPPRISEVYTKGTLTLARLGREAPIAAASPNGPALRNVTGGSLAARLLYPEVRQTRPTVMPRSPVIGTDAPEQYEPALTPGVRPSVVERRQWLMQTPAPCDYERATSVEGAIASLQRVGAGARIIAGGHSLIPMMKLRLATPEHLIDINDLSELSYIRREGDEVWIGALTRHAELLDSELLAGLFPVFADAERVIADPIVRNRGTIGGSLCQADPAEDLSAVCSALKASVVIRGAGGARVVPMSEFHVGPYMTAVGDAEILTEVRIRVRPGAGSAHEKVERRAGDFAIAAASAAVWIDGGTITDAGIALAAAGPSTVEVTRAEEALRGQPPSEELFEQAARSHRRTACRWPTAADRSTTSATSPGC